MIKGLWVENFFPTFQQNNPRWFIFAAGQCDAHVALRLVNGLAVTSDRITKLAQSNHKRQQPVKQVVLLKGQTCMKASLQLTR